MPPLPKVAEGACAVRSASERCLVHLPWAGSWLGLSCLKCLPDARKRPVGVGPDPPSSDGIVPVPCRPHLVDSPPIAWAPGTVPERPLGFAIRYRGWLCFGTRGAARGPCRIPRRWRRGHTLGASATRVQSVRGALLRMPPNRVGSCALERTGLRTPPRNNPLPEALQS